MKTLKRILCSLLAIVTAATAFVACKKDGNETQSGSSSGGSSEQTVTNIEYTNYPLVSGGVSEYKIVLADETLYSERLARDELVDFFYQATGVTLKSVTESETAYSENAKLIILGDTKFTENTGVTVADIPTQGFTLKTVGSNLFILGKDYGVLYGAYEFLHQTFGFEIYAADEIALAKNVKDMKLPKFNFSDNPDILYREPNYGPLNDIVVCNRFRLNDNIWMTEKGNFVHNSIQEYLPLTTYYDDTKSTYRPEFYNDTATQLCYTAHGDAAKLAEMQDIVFERMQYIINKFYNQGDFRESLSFTQEDNSQWCECDTCKEKIALYGANSATLVQFINPVAKRVREWLAQEWPGHTVNIAIFAYVKSEQAPVKNIDGNYLPTRKLTEDEVASIVDNKLGEQTVYTVEGAKFVEEKSLYLEDNVALFYAPFYADYFHDFSSSKNAGYMETMRKWMAVSNKMYLWFYSTNYRDYLMWYDSFNSMQPIYRLVKQSGGIYFFDQGRYNSSALTGFDMLKCYLNSKLAWNVDADYTKMINDFFEHYFKDAAAPMMKYFNSFRSWSQYLKENTSISGNVSTQIAIASYWPKQILTSWEDCIYEAYKAIEPLKATDKTLYEKLYTRIEKEGIAIRFHLYDLHENKYEEATLKELRKQFKADATRLGFTKLTEYGSLETNVYAKWGV